MDKFSFLSNADLVAIEQLYETYKTKPEEVDDSWKQFFAGFELAQTHYNNSPKGEATSQPKASDAHTLKEFEVLSLINGYRQRGHFFTKTNPVRERRSYYPTLDISSFNLTEKDLDVVFQAGVHIGLGPVKLRQIVEHLTETYCRSVGAEFLYIRQPEIVDWLQTRMEKSQNKAAFSKPEKLEMFQNLVHAVGFERFVHQRFTGQKRFSLEGGEAVIPALEAIIEQGAMLGVAECVIGMAHRGRLNVLTNIMRKPASAIFREFAGKEYDAHILQGDVKYHLGYDSDVEFEGGRKVKLTLLPNPSHLETVSGLVEGFSRAMIDRQYQGDFSKMVPILIHGDAAMAGQGIVYEVIQMSALQGYKTGGTIHLIINNQVGFTTNYMEARSSVYCTDIAKVTRSPVFHVNGDDVEAVAYTIRFALEYRERFQADVFIDILCYRRHGHNEGDEPRFTQPTLYKAIAAHPNPRDIYAGELEAAGVATTEELDAYVVKYEQELDQAFEYAKKSPKVSIRYFRSDIWTNKTYSIDSDFDQSPETGPGLELLTRIGLEINKLPGNKKFFNKIEKLVADRTKMITDGQVDWAMGELLAYGSLISQGNPVRLSGQDSVRGTFSHRHASFVVEDTEEKYTPLANLSSATAKFQVYNSPLSEYSVLGFEYGYALGAPNGLTIWEAQFGDFHNVAQPIFDQYISSAEEKWGIMNGLTMLLPHGYEGQGAEHSSARIERFLSMTAGNNMQLVNCTTPANFFHALRRQVARQFNTPLVVFSPKSLLRHPECTSKLDELAYGRFQEVIDDRDCDADNVSRIVLCSGKIYYDLAARKKELGARDIALVRIEQLHPFPKKQVEAILKRYRHNMLLLWVQEEPENMGAWNYIRNEMADHQIVSVSRMASGAPAVGLHELHQHQQQEIISKVFRKCDCDLHNYYCGLQCVKGKSHEEIRKQHFYL